jgi:hypothetical protein
MIFVTQIWVKSNHQFFAGRFAMIRVNFHGFGLPNPSVSRSGSRGGFPQGCLSANHGAEIDLPKIFLF